MQTFKKTHRPEVGKGSAPDPKIDEPIDNQVEISNPKQLVSELKETMSYLMWLIETGQSMNLSSHFKVTASENESKPMMLTVTKIEFERCRQILDFT